MWNALYIKTDGYISDTRPGVTAWRTGLPEHIGELLNGLDPMMSAAGVVVLDAGAAAQLGMPVDPDLIRRNGKVIKLFDHPAQQDAARSGWDCSRVGDWTRFKRGDRSIRVAVEPLLDLTPDKEGRYPGFPLYDTDPALMVAGLALWQRITGVPWFGNPGMAAVDVLWSCSEHRKRGSRLIEPRWRPDYSQSKHEPPPHVFEDDYRWSSPVPGDYTHEVTFDGNRSYVAAMQGTKVASWSLKYTWRREYEPGLAGIWKIELPNDRGRLIWNFRQLPHPAGNLAPTDDPYRTVTHPTMAVLDYACEVGVLSGYRILDSWTDNAREHVLRPTSARLSDACWLRDSTTRQPIPDIPAPLAALVRYALKTAGRHLPGILNTSEGSVTRNDWSQSIRATDRAVRWRRAYQIGTQTGQWPLHISMDEIVYGTSTPHPVKGHPDDSCSLAPAGLGKIDQTGIQLGAHKHKATYRRRKVQS